MQRRWFRSRLPPRLQKQHVLLCSQESATEQTGLVLSGLTRIYDLPEMLAPAEPLTGDWDGGSGTVEQASGEKRHYLAYFRGTSL